ncbi:O-acetylserine/cysteine exporter [Herbaspirillum sp. meg3]|uniref:EamA family transporter n=1 Tax=Herbaspirillum sp. meg3 TaxID=2025949 RepID=UPI000B9848C0|nr:EamA family transporter [Herbaspirillum sp. meg3]ASU37108.1 O-acetylserine/cysteine exporter [Herbaspirillum sp. meg3]
MQAHPMRPAHLALVLLVILVWGVNFAIIKVGLAGVPPMLLGSLRFILAAFPALLFLRPPKVPLRLYLAFGLTMSVGQFAFLFSAIHVGMPSGLASLVLQSQSFFTLLLTVLWLREKWHANQLAGLLLAAGGLTLIGSAHGASMPLLGFLLTIAAAAMWACGNIVSRAVGRYGPMNQLAFVVWASLVPPLPMFALSWVMEGPAAISSALQHMSLQSIAAVAYIAWASTLFGYAVWNFLIARYSVNRVAPFTLLVPLVGLTTGWLAFGEELQAIHFIGAALLMVGLIVNLFGASLFARLNWRARQS